MIDFRTPESPVYIEGGKPLGRLILNRPNKRNAMSEAMWTVLPKAVQALDDDPAVRVIIVTSSSDKAFSAGADIAELQAIAADPKRQESNRLAIRDAQRTLARTRKATIAMIYGACVGGGCGLALHCDFRYAAKSARFGITPARLGLIYPLNDTKQLMDLVGPAHAKSLLFTGRIMDADEALAIGMADALFEGDALAAETEAFAHQIAAASQYSVQGIKATIRRILDGQLDDDAESAEMFRRAHEGVDAAEGVSAFLEKRAPKFPWNG